MSYQVDYHIHSCYSDGTMTPVQLVQKYKEAEYDIISITDHDGIGGLKEASIAAEALKIKFVPGVEISTKHEFTVEAPADAEDAQPQSYRVGIHLLGYDFDPENEALVARLNELKAFRKERNARLADKLAEMGYEIDMKALEGKSAGGYVGKPNIARELVARGYAKDFRDAFDRILESQEIRSIPKSRVSTVEAIELVTNAGGMPVIAHPAKIRGMGERGSDEFWRNMDALIAGLKKVGLKGVECYHPSHSEEERWKLFKIASKYHLHITEGSDFHGEENAK